MKNKILITAIAALNIGMITNSYAEDQKQLKISHQRISSSFYSKLSQHKAQTTTAATGLAILLAAINILSRHNLESSYDIYAMDHKNPIFVVQELTALGIGLLWYAFNMPAPEKTDNFIETTN